MSDIVQTQAQLQFVNSANYLLNYISTFYGNVCLYHRNIHTANEKDYIFDTLAKILQVQQPCCAVLPLYNNDTLQSILISFNSNMPNKSPQLLQYQTIIRMICRMIRSKNQTDLFDI